MTTPLLPHIDLDNLRRLLQRIEADAHRAGWVADGPGLQVYVLYDGADVVTNAQLAHTLSGMGPAIRVEGRYCARVLLPTRIFDRARAGEDGATGGRNPYEYLRNFVMNVAFVDDAHVPAGSSIPDGGMALMRGLLGMTGIFGFAASYEAWGVVGYKPDGPVTATTRIADEPGARETRIVLAVDALDRVHRVQRFRGGKPDAVMEVPMRGDISTSLRIMVDTAYQRLPAANPEAFKARYPSLNEVHGHAGPGRDGGFQAPEDRPSAGE